MVTRRRSAFSDSAMAVALVASLVVSGCSVAERAAGKAVSTVTAGADWTLERIEDELTVSAAQWYESRLGQPMPASAVIRADVSNVFPHEGVTVMVVDVDRAHAAALVAQPSPLGPWDVGPVTAGGQNWSGVIQQLQELVDDPALLDGLSGARVHVSAEERCCSQRDSLPWWNATVAVVDVDAARVYLITWDY